MAYIQERKTDDGKVHYRVQIRLRGFPLETATFEKKTDAKLWAQKTEAEMREGRYFKTAEAKKHTVGEMVDRYIETVIPTKPKNAPACTAQLLWWKNQIGYCLLSDLKPSLIAEQRDKLLKGITKQGKLRSPATTVRYLAALSHALAVAMKEWGWIEDSPMRKVTKPKEPRGRVRFLSDEERDLLLKACQESSNPLLYPVVVVALSTGMREREIMNLRWEDVDIFKGRILLHDTKNGERRSVSLRGKALQLLQQHSCMMTRDIGLLFPSKKNPQKSIDLRYPWEKALKQTGIKNFRFHDCRHSCASYLLMNGASLAEIGIILDHKSPASTKRYSHMSETHESKVVERMNEQIFGV